MDNIQKVLAGNRITIPKKIAEKFRLEVGSLVSLKTNGKGIKISKLEVVENDD